MNCVLQLPVTFPQSFFGMVQDKSPLQRHQHCERVLRVLFAFTTAETVSEPWLVIC